MRLVLRQSFPLGRFHATPWRVNPFDDPFGEWPPSPWRLARAVVARWYQWRRENFGDWDRAELETLIRALSHSTYAFHLPVHARRGSSLRQYHPVEFGWNPAEKKKAGTRTYGTSLTQDNYWCVAPAEGGEVWWFIESDRWTTENLEVLDRCLERITYFGRAESLTQIRRAHGIACSPNCVPTQMSRSSSTVPVLLPERDAQLVDFERVTEDPLAARNIPEGARIGYATRPSRPPEREAPTRRAALMHYHLIQFALGWAVPPEPRAVVRLTARFRSAVLKEQRRIISGFPERVPAWRSLPEAVREQVSEMTGKDAAGDPLQGQRRHTEFLTWWEDQLPTRLLVWREGRSFDVDEQNAILRAASREVSSAAAGMDIDEWKLKLIPLDHAVPPPPGFDGTSASVWESMTPYVPPRHHLRNGRQRPGEAIENQIRRELALRKLAQTEQVLVEDVKPPTWVAVHIPHREAALRSFLGDRRGYWLRLRFEQPVYGPLRLGHSSSFGLGLFAPVQPGEVG